MQQALSLSTSLFWAHRNAFFTARQAASHQEISRQKKQAPLTIIPSTRPLHQEKAMLKLRLAQHCKLKKRKPFPVN